MSKIKILALFGKSGSGKDTIQNLLLQYAPEMFRKIISFTTRPRRDNEIEGFDYHFISEDQFAAMAYDNKFIEALEFNGWFYGSLADDLDKDKINIGIYTPEGIDCLYQTAEEFNLQILPIYIYASEKTRLMRILKRETNPDIKEIFRRYNTDEIDFTIMPDSYKIIHNQSEPMIQGYIIDSIINYCEDFFD